jgi:Flp pilus assembly protein TadG
MRSRLRSTSDPRADVRRRDDEGSATIFVIGFALVLFLCAGLVIDGGLAINKRMRVADDAEQTARIGADSIDVNLFRLSDGKTIEIDQQLAQQRMSDYMSDLGYSRDQWEPRVADGKVEVTVHDVSKTYILSLFDVQFPVQAYAEAVPDTGDTQPEPTTP